MTKRQKQLMLIVNNIDGTYVSVKQARVTGFGDIEKVIQGMP